MSKLIHFGSFDERFCGTKQQCHRFTTEENEVTCPRCKANDTVVLTAQGKQYVRELQAA